MFHVNCPDTLDPWVLDKKAGLEYPSQASQALQKSDVSLLKLNISDSIPTPNCPNIQGQENVHGENSVKLN